MPKGLIEWCRLEREQGQAAYRLRPPAIAVSYEMRQLRELLLP
jgi:hypothetical protein